MTDMTDNPAHAAPASCAADADRQRDAIDHQHMQAALELAAQAIGLSEPNPRVGCLIVDRSGQVIGRGHTQQVGGPHAEVMALRDVASRGIDPAGASAYVTLEPCSHHGRTPPCCDALIAAGLARVVAACTDPNPLVAGQGLARLAGAGLQTRSGVLGDAARELNIGFFSRMLRGRPWVRVKVAASLDGRTALDNGVSQWLTGPEARRDGHAWRRRAGAVLTGLGTLLGDDPRLDVRLVPTQLQPLRVLLDSRLRAPAQARLLQPPGTSLVCTCSLDAQRSAALQAAGAEVLPLAADGDGHVELGAVLAELGRRGINELHVEAGAELNGALLRGGWVDEWLIYLAPKLVGTGRAMAAFGPLHSLDDAAELDFTDSTCIGPDLRLMARPRGRLATWLGGT
jgi:diaminohydroxyphosphoribosylaminopyrimidine deaminase/5-amino-6-(5-phosphoribosylamino)uracil reductase